MDKRSTVIRGRGSFFRHASNGMMTRAAGRERSSGTAGKEKTNRSLRQIRGVPRPRQTDLAHRRIARRREGRRHLTVERSADSPQDINWTVDFVGWWARQGLNL
ncbi:hypothetical protein [Antarcticirhabdus aurantiaca]|uniref:Uncharacterized protein n=1 Tax=Antarcticirhabdus aurantiaca TaxID=2606717 RepID=A0ACD4NVF9_9HYPH|nr:hypothetical protein [Antarcticirhabdus aurantiaca]WAJ30529.1 hypothetical protein OXU80_10120 [Jeongeuplla avenae]